ncbi:MAG: prepilin-type N-terminal cleavage/methylation domain-containing protein [Verrucomicrobiota bacterium]
MRLPDPRSDAGSREMSLKTPRRALRSLSDSGFTLLEIMIASGILFLCLFAILQLLSTSLKNARVLQRVTVDPGMLAAQLSLTNKLAEGRESGDFGKLYPEYRWEREIQEAGTNGLFQVDFVVFRRGGDHGMESHMSILLFRPESTRVGRVGGL